MHLPIFISHESELLMSTKQNLHIHSTYADGKDKPEEMILTAIQRGFDSIGFSEHSYMPFSSYPYQMTEEQAPVYQQEIRSLKVKYAGQIHIFCGMELEFYSDVHTEGYDYLIGSVHYLDFDGTMCGFDRGLEETLQYVANHFGGDGMGFAKKYYETLARLPERKNIDIIGHFDLVTKNNEKGHFLDVTTKEYLHLGYEAIHALQGKIPFFEVNTGAISRGYRTSPYPQMAFLQEFQRLGFGALITSDCHDRNYIDCHFEEARELLAAAGFRTKWILTDSGFVEEAL